MNKKSIALTDEEYRQSVELLRHGFMLDGKMVRPNERIAAIAVVQASLGLRLGDVLKLKMTSFVKDGGRWRLAIHEQKTQKLREFTVPTEVYSFIQEYAVNQGIPRGVKLFDISERQVERHLNKVFSKMGLNPLQYGSHSFRKYFATRVYVENSMNIELVRILLQHSSVSVSQRYISIAPQTVENALAKTVLHLA